MKQNFQKTKVVIGKTPFLLSVLFILTWTFDRAFLCANVTFSILVLSPKKSYFEKGFHFSENLFQSTENVQIFRWLSHKIMPIFQTESYFENP